MTLAAEPQHVTLKICYFSVHVSLQIALPSTWWRRRGLRRESAVRGKKIDLEQEHCY